MSFGRDWNLEIGVDQVLVGQGIDPASVSPRLPALRAAAARAIDAGASMLEPRVASRRVAVERVEGGGVHLPGGIVIRSDAVAHRMDGATELVVAVCTVGDAASRHASALMDRDPVVALALEGLACAGVEALAVAFCREERARAENLGQRVTAPMSPGIDEWPLLVGQQAIFGIVDGAPIGVRLGESGQMQPCKSSSFIVGVGADVRQDEGTSCERCSARLTCRWRAGRERMSGGQ